MRCAERQAEGEVGVSMDREHAVSARRVYITLACLRRQGRHGRAQVDDTADTTSDCQAQVDSVAWAAVCAVVTEASSK
jgi:hypothetical protein